MFFCVEEDEKTLTIGEFSAGFGLLFFRRGFAVPWGAWCLRPLFATARTERFLYVQVTGV
jgi:hypothetical protein